MTAYYDKRSIDASHKFTNCVVDAILHPAHGQPVWTAYEILDRSLEKAGSKAEIARTLGIPTSRVAELYRRKPEEGKPRRLQYAEAVKLLETFFPEQTGATISAETLAPILSVCLRHAPKGGWTEQEVQRLAQAVEYGLGLIATSPANQASADALAVAGQAALSRMRDEHLPA